VLGRFVRKMQDVISAGRANEFFNVGVQELADEGVKVGFSKTEGLAWAEIDDPLDLTFAQANIFPQLSAPAAV
jgi:L-glutamine-phosphate cytidylyltransferase